MKKTFFLIFILGFLFSSLWILKIFKGAPSPVQNSAEKKDLTSCVPFKIAGFAPGNLPYVKVGIEDQEFFFLLDLGFNGDADILDEYLPKIKDKSFIGTFSIYNFRGKEYQNKSYKIPQLKLDDCIFGSVTLEERTQEQMNDSTVIAKTRPPTPLITGKLGWTLFKPTVLCLDLKFSRIAISYTVEVAKQKLHLLWHRFSKTRMLDDNKMIELETMTPQGPLRCMLDSGCTSNILNTDNPTDEPLDQMISNEENSTHFSSFQVGDKDFGPITFYPLPLKFPFHVEAILGVEFLLEHVVIIDFPNREIYIAPSVAED